MKLTDAKILAETYLEQHLKNGWVFDFDNAVNRFGSCRHHSRRITLSRKLTKVNDMDRVERVIIHEVAHAVLGRGYGHSSIWKSKCLELGGDGERCFTDDNTIMPKLKYTLTCPKCGTTISRSRLGKSAKKSACNKCCKQYNNNKYTDEFLFRVTQNY
jgi:predicted SprT family Zn-dependent metalloprotease